jgi:hypothetical protein
MRYERPRRDWVLDRQKSPELITLERLRQEMVKASAREWINVMDLPAERFHGTAIPQAIYDTLGDFDVGAARVAAQAFLEDYPESGNMSDESEPPRPSGA